MHKPGSTQCHVAVNERSQQCRSHLDDDGTRCALIGLPGRLIWEQLGTILWNIPMECRNMLWDSVRLGIHRVDLRGNSEYSWLIFDIWAGFRNLGPPLVCNGRVVNTPWPMSIKKVGGASGLHVTDRSYYASIDMPWPPAAVNQTEHY